MKLRTTEKLLLEYRIRRGWSQRRLAEELGVSVRTVEAWEQGTRKINRFLAGIIAETLKNETKKTSNFF